MITPRQRHLINALRGCSFLPASRDKRFVADMQRWARPLSSASLSDAQARYLESLRHKYRRQFSEPCDCTQCAVNGVQQELAV